MGPVVLINPNTNTATTAMMTGIAATWMRDRGLEVIGRTVSSGPAMITDPEVLPAAARAVVATGVQAVAEVPGVVGIIVSAFAEPGVDELAGAVSVPVVGIAGAGIRQAAAGRRPFGIATVAPALAEAVTERVHHYRCAERFTGVRAVDISPDTIAKDPDALLKAMIQMAELCVATDGAEVVIIGGGPLGAVAAAIQAHLSVTTVSPITAACAEIAEHQHSEPITRG